MLVKAKRNGRLRFVTRPVNNRHFEDDGIVSCKKPSNTCWWEEYEPYFDSQNELYKSLRPKLGSR